MKNAQNGFIILFLIAIIALLVVGGGVYVWHNKTSKTTDNKNPITSENNSIGLKARIDNSTESPAYFNLVVQATPEKVAGIKKMMLKLSCESPEISISVGATQEDAPIELCAMENEVELKKDINDTYNIYVPGNSSKNGLISITVTAYGVNGEIIGNVKTSLPFEYKTYDFHPKSTVNSPKKGMTYYVGDTLLIDFTPIDTTKNYQEVKGVIYLHGNGTREVVSEFAGGHYTWKIPLDIKPGEYYLEINTAGQYLDNYTFIQISAINYALEYNNSFYISK